MFSKSRSTYRYLLDIEYDNSWRDNYQVRPPKVLNVQKAKAMMCLEAALYAVYLFERDGVEVHFLGIHREDEKGNQCGHCACIFKDHDLFGAVSITFIDSLRSFEPKYETLDQVAEHFAKAYKSSGYKPLYFGYYNSSTFSNALGFDWKETEKDLSEISDYIVSNYQYEIKING